MYDEKKIGKILKRKKLFLMRFSSGWYGRPYDNLYKLCDISQQEDSLTLHLDGYDVFLKKPLHVTLFRGERSLRKWLRVETPHIVFSDETKKIREEKDGWVEFY